MCGAIGEESLTPREQFEVKFGPIDDEQWQWLKEFVQKSIDANEEAIHNTWGDRFGKDQKGATDELPSWFHKCPVRGSIVLSGDRVWCGACGQTQTRRAMSAATEKEKAVYDNTIQLVEFMQSELPRLVADEHDRRELERSEEAAYRAIDRAEKWLEICNMPHTAESSHERSWRWFGLFRRGD